MKKGIALILATVMVLSLAACGAGSTASDPSEWPSGTVTLYLPYNESSPNAQNATVLADWIREATGGKVETEYDATGNGESLAQKLLSEDADGLQIMAVGLDALSAYHQGIWTNDPTDESKFTIVTGMMQPYPYAGCILITQKDSPFDDWASFEAYVKANPGTVTVADRTGSSMTTKLRALFNQTELSGYVDWIKCNRDELSLGIENGSIMISVHDETNAAKTYLAQPDKYKAIINCRPDNDFSYYPEDTVNLDLIKAVPTLQDVFGPEKAAEYNVPNTIALVVKAGTDPQIVAKIREVIEGLLTVPESTDEASFYMRQRNQGGTSRFYTWPAEDILREWQRLSPIVKEIETGSK